MKDRTMIIVSAIFAGALVLMTVFILLASLVDARPR